MYVCMVYKCTAPNASTASLSFWLSSKTAMGRLLVTAHKRSNTNPFNSIRLRKATHRALCDTRNQPDRNRIINFK